MKRYHKKVYFPDTEALNAFNDDLNNVNWTYSNHCLNHLKHRVINLNNVLQFIKYLKLKSEWIFEYYKTEKIIKACYRIPYNEMDLILVISSSKTIITIYLNSRDDKHYTLNRSLYQYV